MPFISNDRCIWKINASYLIALLLNLYSIVLLFNCSYAQFSIDLLSYCFPAQLLSCSIDILLKCSPALLCSCSFALLLKALLLICSSYLLSCSLVFLLKCFSAQLLPCLNAVLLNCPPTCNNECSLTNKQINQLLSCSLAKLLSC